MKKLNYKTIFRSSLADLHTPVSIYLQLRDKMAHCLLLESSDYQSRENSYSFICADPLAEVLIQNRKLHYNFPNEEAQVFDIPPRTNVSNLLKQFCDNFSFEGADDLQKFNGLYGHTNFDAVQYFESIELDQNKRQHDMPDMRYALYRFLIIFNHYNSEMYILENLLEGEESNLHKIEQYLNRSAITTYDFELNGEQTSNLSDEAFKTLVRKGKHHCAIGDVFQIVFSRQFQQKFKGDEFNVYRTLRSINPSPYLFFFDYGDYKIFGSSPEAQLVVRDKKAMLMPIAGTYKRTGNIQKDKKNATALLNDPKENAEHVMLVDLARNDLNRHTENVTVTQYKEVHFYSHVIHLVSKVEGNLDESVNVFQVFGDTFPAGTLSGAPKYKALQLIDQYENQNRGFYGGAIGIFNPKGQLNQAIVIRSFMSRQNCLYFQAGAGIVIGSNEEKELQEVNNKLAALQKALERATEKK
ncbi:anthranilate synthase component I family protein [Aureispira]|nr:anthranilate synthase component I family protein [Aureispira sp.]